MALQMSYDDVFGNPTHAAGYFVIKAVDFNKHYDGTMKLNISIDVYRDIASYQAGKAPLKSFLYQADQTNTTVNNAVNNWCNTIYNYLKTLAFFNGAVDA